MQTAVILGGRQGNAMPDKPWVHFPAALITPGLPERMGQTPEVMPIAGADAQIPRRSQEVPVQPIPKKPFHRCEPAPKVSRTKAAAFLSQH